MIPSFGESHKKVRRLRKRRVLALLTACAVVFLYVKRDVAKMGQLSSVVADCSSSSESSACGEHQLSLAVLLDMPIEQLLEVPVKTSESSSSATKWR